MSKKMFLRRSFAEVVKGSLQDSKAESETACTPQETFPEEYCAGESVIKPQLTGFPYRKRTQSSSSSSDDVKENYEPRKSKSPRKIRRSNSFKGRSASQTLQADQSDDTDLIPQIILSSSEDDSTQKLGNQECIILSSESEASPSKCPEKLKTDRDLSSSSEDEYLPTPEKAIPENKQDLYENDPNLPVHQRLQHRIKTYDAVGVLLSDLDETMIAKTVPLGIAQNVSFVVSSDAVGHWKNFLCDGMGSWKQTGKHSFCVHVTDDGCIKLSENSEDSKLTAMRSIYVNKSSPDLHRVLIQLVDNEHNNYLDYFYVQYYFDGPEHSFDIKPHGNDRQNRPYQPTMTTTKSRIKELCEKSLKPKQVERNILAESGGIEKAASGSQLCRDRQQIKNIKRVLKAPDSLVACADLSKVQENSKDRFVRDVRTGGEFTVFLSSDRQLCEVEKFCTNPKNFSVLGVDTTFNIGDYFYVTITTYRNLMLVNKNGTEPVMIGPSIIHQKKTFDSYFKLPSNMIQVRWKN